MAKLHQAGACIALLSALCMGSARAEVVVNESQDIYFTEFVPCANGGAGEVIDLSGPLHVLINFTINDNHVSGKLQLQSQGISGVGESTGLRYQAVGSAQGKFGGSFQNGQFNASLILNYRLIGQGPGNNFLVHDNAHITVNANGEVTTTHDNFSIECK